MARCQNCSAPLPANSALCSYCGTRNDMDFTVAGRFTGTPGISRRHCPHCQILLQTIHLTADGAFAVDRCQQCLGLFFVPGEVRAFLDAAVAPAYTIYLQEIGNINRERAAQEVVRYIPCPDCGKLMNRVSFGYRSGVVVDQCKEHGVWLDNGEIVHLMEWKKAGGQLLDAQKQAERQQTRPARISSGLATAGLPAADIGDPSWKAVGGDLVDAAVALLERLFG
jgi:Zn-finger nucleic acid-binding protein